ncbi:MAG: hypothetical protein J1F01_00515 [Oscillospiraceae bacterium]|nr:hypothetical protein [Oscillospiraceae bacterium]
MKKFKILLIAMITCALITPNIAMAAKATNADYRITDIMVDLFADENGDSSLIPENKPNSPFALVNPETNHIIILAPLDDAEHDYEYSFDGGTLWTDETESGDLGLNQIVNVKARQKASDNNHTVSEPSNTSVTTYKYHLLVYRVKSDPLVSAPLAAAYTNEQTFTNIKDLNKKVFTEQAIPKPARLKEYYIDALGTTPVDYETFTMSATESTILYASQSTAGGGGEDEDNPEVDEAVLDECVAYIMSRLNLHETTIDISQFDIPYSNDVALKVREKVIASIQYDHPEIFYVLPNQGSFGFTAEAPEGIWTNIIFNYTLTEDEIIKRQAMIEAEAEHIEDLINEDMSDVEKVLTVHDYIIANYAYDYSYSNRSLDTMVMDKKGVCHGYVHLFGYMMNKLGIECQAVPSDENAHIWNKVKIDGKWYHIDVTSDDPSPAAKPFDGISPSSEMYRLYFLQSDEGIKQADRTLASYGVRPLHSTWNDEGKDPITEPYPVLSNIHSQMVYSDGLWYYFDADKNLCSLDMETKNSEILYDGSKNFTWLWGSILNPDNPNYSSLIMYNGDLYFNSRNAIYRYSIENGIDEEPFMTFDLKASPSEQYKPDIYGLHMKNDTFYIEISYNINYGVTYIADYEKYFSEITETDTEDTLNISLTKALSYTPDEKDVVYVAEYKNGTLVNLLSKTLREFEAAEKNEENSEVEENADFSSSFKYTLSDSASTEVKVFIWNSAQQSLASVSVIEFEREAEEDGDKDDEDNKGDDGNNEDNTDNSGGGNNEDNTDNSGDSNNEDNNTGDDNLTNGESYN